MYACLCTYIRTSRDVFKGDHDFGYQITRGAEKDFEDFFFRSLKILSATKIIGLEPKKKKQNFSTGCKFSKYVSAYETHGQKNGTKLSSGDIPNVIFS